MSLPIPTNPLASAPIFTPSPHRPEQMETDVHPSIDRRPSLQRTSPSISELPSETLTHVKSLRDTSMQNLQRLGVHVVRCLSTQNDDDSSLDSVWAKAQEILQIERCIIRELEPHKKVIAVGMRQQLRMAERRSQARIAFLATCLASIPNPLGTPDLRDSLARELQSSYYKEERNPRIASPNPKAAIRDAFAAAAFHMMQGEKRAANEALAPFLDALKAQDRKPLAEARQQQASGRMLKGLLQSQQSKFLNNNEKGLVLKS